MADVTIYGPPQSTYVRTVRLALEEKSAPYSFGEFEFGSDGHKALHPFAKVPAFKHGDVQLFESLAIATYVDGTFDGPALQPADALARAQMMQWITSTIDYIYPYAIRKVVWQRVVVPSRGGETDEEIIKEAQPHLEYCLSVANKQLTKSPYLAGNECSLGDFFVAPILFWLNMIPEGQEALKGKDALNAWFAKLSERKSFVDTVPPPPEQVQAAE